MFQVETPWSDVVGYQRFRGSYWNVGILPQHYTVSWTRKPQLEILRCNSRLLIKLMFHTYVARTGKLESFPVPDKWFENSLSSVHFGHTDNILMIILNSFYYDVSSVGYIESRCFIGCWSGRDCKSAVMAYMRCKVQCI